MNLRSPSAIRSLCAAFLGALLTPYAAATTFEFTSPTQSDKNALFESSTTWLGMQNPGLSQANQGVIYFDTSAYHFMVSENGGAYFTLQSGQILIDTQTFSGENSFVNSITLQSSSITLVGSGANVGVFLNNGAVAVTPTGFSGNGFALTNLNGAAITGANSVPASVLPSTIAYTTITNTFTASQQFGSGAAMSTFTATGNLQLVGGSTVTTNGTTLTLSTSSAAGATAGPGIFLQSNGNVGIGTSGPSLNLSLGAGARTFGVENAGASTATGGSLTIQSGAGGTATTGGAGGNLGITAGSAGGTGNNAGGDITLSPGVPTGTGAAGFVAIAGGAGNSHLRSTQTTAPTAGTPAACGGVGGGDPTQPTASLTAGSTDMAGQIVIVAGTGAGQGTCTTVITFQAPGYAATPKSILLQGNTTMRAYISAASATSFSVTFTADSTAGATYGFYYIVIE